MKCRLVMCSTVIGIAVLVNLFQPAATHAQEPRIFGSIQKNLTALVPAKDADNDPPRNVLTALAQSGVKP